MKPTLAYAFLACTMLAAPAAAQDYYGAPLAIGAYDGYYDYDRPVPPRPVPGYGVGTTRTVVTTRRIISAPPAYGGHGYGEPETVVTTRRVVAPRPVIDEDDVQVTRSVLPPPSPYRRVLKNETIVGPGFRPAGVVVTRRVAPAAPVIIEERRVETTRRVLRPGVGEWLD
jgi:hypothetical protein